MQGSFKVGTIGGIAIRVHYTWIFAVFLIAWSLALGYFPSSGQGRGAGTDWLLAIVAALLLFGSVLVHELGHSLVARARGLRVQDITLFIFGGISSIAQEAASAWDEFVVAVVGPLISLALAGLCWAVGQVVPPESVVNPVARYLGMANLLLGLFNIVPGFPLDGGRVLRAILWGATGDMARATRLASYVGQAIAFVLIGWGVLSALGGDLLGGFWIAFIGWFLNSGAEGSRRQLDVRRALDGVPVSSVMDPSPATAGPGLSIRDFVQEYALRRGQRALPVVEAGQLVGIVSITDAGDVAQDAWATARVDEVMTRLPLKTLAPEADLSAALELMVNNGVHQLPILRDGALVGLLSRADVLHYLQLGAAPPRGAAQAAAAAPPLTAASRG
jgi:Zn-dependent protease/CBS domain-containing protein